MKMKIFTVFAALFGVLLGATAWQAEAQFRADEFDYGSRFRLPDGQQPTIWNPAKRKLLDGGDVVPLPATGESVYRYLKTVPERG